MTATTLILWNTDEDRSCHLFWIPSGRGGGGGDRTPARYYATVESKRIYKQPTYVGHEWICSSSRTKPMSTIRLRAFARDDEAIRCVPRSICSYDESSKTSIGFRMRSDSPSRRANVFWVPAKGEERSCGSIDPAKALHLTSYQGHLFRVRDIDGKCLMECTASSAAQTYDVCVDADEASSAPCKFERPESVAFKTNEGGGRPRSCVA